MSILAEQRCGAESALRPFKPTALCPVPGASAGLGLGCAGKASFGMEMRACLSTGNCNTKSVLALY